MDTMLASEFWKRDGFEEIKLFSKIVLSTISGKSIINKVKNINSAILFQIL